MYLKGADLENHFLCFKFQIRSSFGLVFAIYGDINMYRKNYISRRAKSTYNLEIRIE